MCKRAASSGASSAFPDTCGVPISDFSDHKALESLDKIAEHNRRIQRWIQILTAYNNTLVYRKGSANGNASFLSRLPLPATELDRGGPSGLTPSDEERVFFIRSHGLLLGGPSAVRSSLGGLSPSDPNSGWSGLTLSPHDFQDFTNTGHE